MSDSKFDNRDNICDCGKSFSRRSNLKIHEKSCWTKEPRMDFFCLLCLKATITKQQLDRHKCKPNVNDEIYEMNKKAGSSGVKRDYTTRVEEDREIDSNIQEISHMNEVTSTVSRPIKPVQLQSSYTNDDLEESYEVKTKTQLFHQEVAVNNNYGSTYQTTACEEKFQSRNIEDALSYLKEVKKKLNDHEVYNVFLDTIKKFKDRSIDRADVVEILFNMLKGDSELIAGFARFILPDYEIEVKRDCSTMLKDDRAINIHLESSDKNDDLEELYDFMVTTDTQLFHQEVDVTNNYGWSNWKSIVSNLIE